MFKKKRNTVKYTVAVREILDYPSTQKLPISSKLLYKNSATPNSFHDAMKLPLTLMQFFGFFPVGGIRDQIYRNLRFKWLTWKVLYSLVSLLGYLINFVLFCRYKKINNILEINALFFHIENIVLMPLCMNLASKWPNFVKEWHLVEVSMKSYELSRNMKRHVIVVCTVVLSVALTEHVMYTTTTIMKSINAYPDSSYDAMYEYFVHQTFTEIFYYVPFHVSLAFIFKFLVIQKTFMWTFIDVFIIAVSICFNFRLQQITKRLSSLSRIEISNNHVWRVIREDYVKLSRLCDIVNKHLCWFIIISYLSNIHYILAQLYSSLKPIENIFEKIYFYVSFFLLILRIILVCIFGGAIHDEHGEIVKVLSGVPSSVYDIEVERFITHLGTCDMALSGKSFFRITRNLILKVTSAIVTYELVLIQFNAQDFKNKEL